MTAMMLFLSLLIALLIHLGVSFHLLGEENRETHKEKQDWLSLVKF